MTHFAREYSRIAGLSSPASGDLHMHSQTSRWERGGGAGYTGIPIYAFCSLVQQVHNEMVAKVVKAPQDSRGSLSQ